MRSFGQSVGVCLLSVIALLVLLEGALSILEPERDGGPVQVDGDEFLTCRRDSVLGWVFPPSTHGVYDSRPHPTDVRTNEEGIRNRAIGGKGRSVRVLVLGDSYAFGWGVPEDDAFPGQLESMIRERLRSTPVEVINAAIPGYGLYQQRAMLLNVLSVTDVDVVVSTFSLANDAVDDLRIERYAPDRLTDYSADVAASGSLLDRIAKRSRLVALLDLKTKAVRFQIANVRGEALRLTFRNMADLLQICSERGIPVVCVTVPHRSEVAAGALKARVACALSSRARRLHSDLVNQYGVPLIDVTDALSEAHRAEDVYLPNGRHWSRAGHRAVAAAVLETLPEEWLLEPSPQ